MQDAGHRLKGPPESRIDGHLSSLSFPSVPGPPPPRLPPGVGTGSSSCQPVRLPPPPPATAPSVVMATASFPAPTQPPTPGPAPVGAMETVSGRPRRARSLAGRAAGKGHPPSHSWGPRLGPDSSRSFRLGKVGCQVVAGFFIFHFDPLTPGW